MICPCCGQPLDPMRPLTVSPRLGLAFWKGEQIRGIGAGEVRVLAALMQAGSASHDTLCDAVSPLCTPQSVQVRLSHLRKAFAVYGIPIRIENRRARCYIMTEGRTDDDSPELPF